MLILPSADDVTSFWVPPWNHFFFWQKQKKLLWFRRFMALNQPSRLEKKHKCNFYYGITGYSNLQCILIYTVRA